MKVFIDSSQREIRMLGIHVRSMGEDGNTGKCDSVWASTNWATYANRIDTYLCDISKKSKIHGPLRFRTGLILCNIHWRNVELGVVDIFEFPGETSY